jgi:hypothetical protein
MTKKRQVDSVENLRLALSHAENDVGSSALETMDRAYDLVKDFIARYPQLLHEELQRLIETKRDASGKKKKATKQKVPQNLSQALHQN